MATPNIPSDLQIARSVEPIRIWDIAQSLGISGDDLEQYGNFKAKVPLKYIDQDRLHDSHLVLVTAITPTPPGEGKTTTSIALSDGLNRIGEHSMVVIREPSVGPVFGMKGGAAGGGYAQVIPMEDINLHFTGDFAAIEKANNLLAALIDNNIQNWDTNLGIDPRTVVWKRVMDMNDRALRHVITGLSGKAGGFPREAGFQITAASEIMAILCLADHIEDLKKKIGDIYVGDTYEGEAIYARELKADGAMTVLLKDAIKPNLVQTLEGNPAIIHGGPFANIAHGTNSVIGTRMGLSLCDWVVTEAGFGADLGAEKYFDIKCGYSGLSPQAVVLVATVRALKYHGGSGLADLTTPNPEALSKGLDNLEQHLENLALFEVPVVVCINRFTSDSEEELEIIMEKCREHKVEAITCQGWEKGSEGAMELAAKVKEMALAFKGRHKPLYDWEQDVKSKIDRIATQIYGAGSIKYWPKANADLRTIKRLGIEGLPICMAKTHRSISDNPKLLGRVKGFELNVKQIEIANGAGFLIPITGNMLRMPGLPSKPAAENMDIDNQGNVTGLS